jgi:hypothetical protein
MRSLRESSRVATMQQDIAAAQRVKRKVRDAGDGAAPVAGGAPRILVQRFGVPSNWRKTGAGGFEILPRRASSRPASVLRFCAA